jgi:hypothetical protein
MIQSADDRQGRNEITSIYGLVVHGTALEGWKRRSRGDENQVGVRSPPKKWVDHILSKTKTTRDEPRRFVETS